MTKSRGILAPRTPWGCVELELLRRNYADSLTEDIAIAIGRPVDRVYAMAHKLGLHKTSEFNSRTASDRQQALLAAGKHKGFPKGNVPANKGRKNPGWSAGNMASTWFKKGGKPCTTLPVGSYRVNGDGFLEVKFGEAPGPYTMRWKPVHRMVWERAHGPIPKGHVLRFKPGRHTTRLEEITLDAIELLTHAQNLALNSVHNLPKELVKVVQLRGVLNRQINKRSKQG